MMKKICFVTGSRAEYGLLAPLIRRIAADRSCIMQIIATGMHLMKANGLTFRDIEKEFVISAKVPLRQSGTTEKDIAYAVGAGVTGMTDAYARLNPDAVILLGDRHEIFAAAVAAFLSGIPIIHIHGGEVTEGAIDDGLRHAITKMSSLHFTAAEAYRRRVIQLGEEPRRVFNVGSLGVENINTTPLLSRQDLEKKLQCDLSGRYALVTFHPETREIDFGLAQLKNLITVLEGLQHIRVIVTMPNADAGGRQCGRLIKAYARRHPERTKVFESMGQLNYLSAMKYAAAVIGNSSSGIIEAPALNIPTVNIGCRQKGRLRAGSVIDAGSSVEAISRAVKKALSAPFRRRCAKAVNPYGAGDASKKIAALIKKNTALLKNNQKSFYDMGSSRD